MSSPEIVSTYFAAWTRRDPDTIAALFAPDATFRDPAGQRPAAGVAAHARRLFDRFPALAFEPRGAPVLGDGTVLGRWTIRPNGGERAVDGVDVVAVADGRITAVERYYDAAALAAPEDSMAAGTVVRVGTGRRAQPGALGVTWQEARTQAGQEFMRRSTDAILRELPGTPGFIGGISATIGDRFLTVTAWDDADAPFELIRSGAHRFAAVRFFGPDLVSAGWTGVWAPTRLSPLRVRCPACGRMTEATSGRCGCGAELPEPPAYW